MDYFEYRSGLLHAEGVSLGDIAGEIGTPFYCYSTATLERHYNVLSAAFGQSPHRIFYAMKANSNQAVLKTLAVLGAGMDVVSEGELRRALAVGVPGRKIVFSGVGKTAHEMALALKEGVACFNVESEPELELLSQICQRTGQRAHIAIRVNPDVDAKTHAKITTGKSENKFGIAFSRARAVYAHAARLPGLIVTGLDMHIGSQITSLTPFEQAFKRMAELAKVLLADGHKLQHLDIGGGIGAPYRPGNDVPPHPDEYAAVVKQALGSFDLPFWMEPGRVIAANAGVLVTRVIYCKETDGHHFVIQDGGMNDLIRPTLYDAHHEIKPVKQAEAEAQLLRADVVGPVCESGDYLAKGRPLPPLAQGDLLAVMTAGAYGAVQAGTYNSRGLVPEVLVKGDQWALIRSRQSLDDLIKLDELAPWQD